MPVRSIALTAALAFTQLGFAADAPVAVPRAVAVRAALAPPPKGVVELKFAEIFRLPVGPRGFELSERVRALDGQRVRVIGYMVAQEAGSTSFLLAPLPVTVDHDDESLADDIPASVVRVELPPSARGSIPVLPGLLQFTGVLRVGDRADPADGRIAPVRLELDPKTARALASVARRKP